MSPLLVAAILGIVVNTVAVSAVIWRGGVMVGNMNTTLGQLAGEIHALRETRDEHIGILARIVGQLETLEGRMRTVERRGEERRTQERRGRT